MAREKTEIEQRTDDRPADRNDLVLVGRVSADPEVKQLPSGDCVWLFRLVVRRPEGAASRQTVDTLECSAWSPRVQRSVSGWREGDMVEVTGSVRRRFFRAGGVPQSRVEVEVATARLRRRAAAG
ncbi:single-stranded DNA-binding protein [Nocardioides sp. REDSEA-S30_B4]|jgi:single-strand DNA-binding protein|uniref:single-stranded DNA-binding protein n=1 Tax=Nocardioides sp. REDSEA-S30_B4 TaxID=1811552 RepID=UPI0025FF90B6|nr:single-stranded DNA-binding protein [Nocardioides sp. REDSEA-S30_B4]